MDNITEPSLPSAVDVEENVEMHIDSDIETGKTCEHYTRLCKLKVRPGFIRNET